MFRLSRNGNGKGAWLDPEDTKTQICDNLVAAGVLLEDETRRYRQVLGKYDFNELLRVLIYSHDLKELDH